MTLSFAPDAIERWPLERLKPYAKNAKMHGPDQVAKIAASMAEFGWTVPCLVSDDGELIAGHGRVLAAEQLGLSGILVTFSELLTESANRAALAFRAKLEVESWSGIEETSASLTSVYVGFDSSHIGHAKMVSDLKALLSQENWYALPLPQKRKLWKIPTAFGNDLGPQLDEVAALAGVSPQEAIAQISTQHVRVMTIGFAPGQPYLGQLSPNWDIPRQTGLTPQVPVGALAVAIRQLVLFTTQTPTGWRHIGQTEFRGFRPDSEVPFVMRPGDEVIFQPTNPEKLANIRGQNENGDGGATWEEIK